MMTGMAINLSLVIEEAHPVAGAVRKISQSVDPSPRLVDVFVSVPSPSAFLLGQYVSDTIVVASVEGLIVPKSAVCRVRKH